MGHPLEEDDNGRWEAAGFHLHLPSSLAGSKDPSRKQEHAPLVQSQRLRRAGSALHAVASSPSTISLTLAAAGIPYVEEAGKLDKKAVCRVGRGPERAVLPRLPPREKRWVGAGLPDAQSYNAACCMLLCALSRWRRWPRCDY